MIIVIEICSNHMWWHKCKLVMMILHKYWKGEPLLEKVALLYVCTQQTTCFQFSSIYMLHTLPYSIIIFLTQCGQLSTYHFKFTCEWCFLEVASPWFTSTRRKFVHYNRPLRLVHRNSRQEKTWIILVCQLKFFKIQLFKNCNQKPPIDNQKDSFMHILNMSHNEQVFS